MKDKKIDTRGFVNEIELYSPIGRHLGREAALLPLPHRGLGFGDLGVNSRVSSQFGRRESENDEKETQRDSKQGMKDRLTLDPFLP